MAAGAGDAGRGAAGGGKGQQGTPAAPQPGLLQSERRGQWNAEEMARSIKQSADDLQRLNSQPKGGGKIGQAAAAQLGQSRGDALPVASGGEGPWARRRMANDVGPSLR